LLGGRETLINSCSSR